MSGEITTAFVQQFNSTVRMLQQQADSRLRSAVMVDSSVVGDRAFYDQVDATTMSEVTNRHGDTEYTDTPHRRRMVTLATHDVADLVDRADQRRLLADPVNPYSKSMAAAANRQIDDIVLAAFDASASTGVDGSTSTALPAGFSFSEASATNFAHADLINARDLLEAQENHEDDGENSWHVVCSSNQRQNLLSDSVIQSIDTNTVRALVNGEINTYLGFNFIKSQRAAIDGSSIRDVFFWVKSSMQLAIGEEPRSFIDRLPAKRHSIQVRYEIDAGATRMDEKGVVRCLASEA